MLLRSSSTPGLCSLAHLLEQQHGEYSESPFNKSSCNSSICTSTARSSSPRDQLDWDFEQELVPWPHFRKVQSENDLKDFSDKSKNTTPKKRWSRRMSLTRHSSLPVSTGESILDELQAPLPGLLEDVSSDDEENDGNGYSTKGSLDVGSTNQLTMVEDCTNEKASVSGRNFTYSQSHENVKTKDGSLYMAGGIGMGIGGGGSVKKRFSSGGGGGGNPEFIPPDSHYQKLLECDPGQPLLLRNYARYLHEVERDFSRAEEYYGRAILAAPDDPELRSLYAKFIWDVHKDAERASGYFEQATQAAPDDCYILGAYASFMWDTEEEDQSTNQTIPPVVAVSA